MKELIVVSKTHLDLGFTDYAAKIEKKYLTEFIPSAIETAESLNRDGEKRFVWTTGSWILKEALNTKDEELRNRLRESIKKGDIAPHALPFTTHTELLDRDLLEYGLSLVDEIDAISGRKTIAAKMTDVPGHTAAMIPMLAAKGVRLLHIGVNGASAMPKVPECFLWKFGNSEIVVIYSGDYGGVFRSELTENILYFDHTLDNRGVNQRKAIIEKFRKLQKEYPDYRVRAGRIDDIADALWEKRAELPVIEQEIGDTWIHGIASDPYKTAALKRLCDLKTRWIQDGTMERESREYREFADALLCVAEHTWGMDTKTHFGDYEHYLIKDFQTAREKDVVRNKNPFVYFPIGFVNTLRGFFGKRKPSYSQIERSWSEQRDYLEKAVGALNGNREKEARSALNALKPLRFEFGNAKKYRFQETLQIGDNSVSVNRNGGVTLKLKGKTVLDAKDLPLIEYRSYGSEDYRFWLNHYTRNYDSVKRWAVGDFARPGLERFDGKYPVGLFAYTAVDAEAEVTEISVNVKVKLECDKTLTEFLGAPKETYAEYRLTREGLSIRLVWLKKNAVRTTESIALKLYPQTNESFQLVKLGEKIDSSNVVENGGRKLSAVEKVVFTVNSEQHFAECAEAPLVATDGGNVLRFDNKIGTPENGLTFVLYNNVWGTNFPLWYGESAEFNVVVR